MKNARPWDLLNPEKKNVPDHIYNERYTICKNCEFFIDITKQCKKCMCFMNFKCSLSNAFCPEGKWEVYLEKESK